MPAAPVLNDQFIVETEHGLQLGQVVSLHDRLPDATLCSTLTVLRAATDADKATAQANEELARAARTFCQESIRSRELDMKLVDVEVHFDASRSSFSSPPLSA